MVVMKTRIFARIQDGIVAETLATSKDIVTMFHPALVWVDASTVAGIAPGWSYGSGTFLPPAEPPAATVSTISELQA